MVQLIEEFSPTSSKERFGQAFANAGQVFGAAYPEMLAAREAERQGMAQREQVGQLTGMDVSNIRDPELLKAAMLAGFKANEPPKPEKDKLSPFDETRMREAGKVYNTVQQDLLQSGGKLTQLRELEDIVDRLKGPSGWFKVLSKDAADLVAKSSTLIGDVIDILNPSGPLAKDKLKLILDTHSVKFSDPTERAKGKIKAVADIVEAKQEHQRAYLQLLEQYGGLPPADVIQQLDDYTANVIEDIALSSGVIDPKDYEKKFGDSDPRISEKVDRLTSRKKKSGSANAAAFDVG